MLETTYEYFFGVGYKEAVRIDMEAFPIREGEDVLPIQRAWCKNCAKETAKVRFPIYMHGKPAYALECEKCGNVYHMYKSMFNTRYVGYTTPSGGHYAPTHGVLSRKQVMDRKAREDYNNIPKKVEEDMCKHFNLTKEEYREKKKKWDANANKVRKRIDTEKAEVSARITDRKIKEESDTRKELIQRGVLKYIKGIGLVNTETNEVVKLK